MRMLKGPECKTEIKKAVINNQYYLKLLFLEKSFDEYPEKFWHYNNNGDGNNENAKKILYINKVDWTFRLSSRLHFLGFYKLKKHYRACSVKRNFSGLAVEGSGMPMYLKKNPLRKIFP